MDDRRIVMVDRKSTPRSVESIKRRAKAISKADGIPHTSALDVAAKEAGYASFRQLQIEQLRLNDTVVLTITLKGTDHLVMREVVVPRTLPLDHVKIVVQCVMNYVTADLRFHYINHLPRIDLDYLKLAGKRSIPTKWLERLSLAHILSSKHSSLEYHYHYRSWTIQVDIADNPSVSFGANPYTITNGIGIYDVDGNDTDDEGDILDEIDLDRLQSELDMWVQCGFDLDKLDQHLYELFENAPLPDYIKVSSTSFIVPKD